MTDTPIEFPKHLPRAPVSSPDTGIRLSGTEMRVAEPSAASNRVVGSTALATIPIDKLYPASAGTEKIVVRVLGLLADAIALLGNGRNALRNNEPVSADRFTQRFKMMLPDLFSCREIGDGYGVVINSIHFAAINLHGVPLSDKQLITVWRVLRELRNKPFISLDEGIALVEELEASGLQVDPPVIHKLLFDSEDE